MIEAIKALVRPILTWGFAIVWAWITVCLIIHERSISVPYILLTTVAWGVIVWYYDDRTFFHRHSSPLSVIAEFLKIKK